MSRILIVDDVAAARLVLSAILDRLGHEVCAAAGASEALRIYRESAPDAVMTDLHLADGEDGIDLARRLREMAEGRAVRMALMTGDAREELKTEGLFDAILEKPVGLEELQEFLKGVGE